MSLIRSSYHPIDAAILWCGLAGYEAEILPIALSHPAELLKYFPQWPSLHLYAERIFDAIDCHELPATYLGHPVEAHDRIERAFLTIRHSDLRVWVACYYPDEKPGFLFKNDHTQSISFATYLTLTAHLEAAERELKKVSRDYEELIKKTSLEGQQNSDLAITTKPSSTPSEPFLYYRIIGSLLAVIVGKSQHGQIQSIYKNQSAVVDAITSQFPGVPGLSKRTLDRKFAEARRLLAQATQG